MIPFILISSLALALALLVFLRLRDPAARDRRRIARWKRDRLRVDVVNRRRR